MFSVRYQGVAMRALSVTPVDVMQLLLVPETSTHDMPVNIGLPALHFGQVSAETLCVDFRYVSHVGSSASGLRNPAPGLNVGDEVLNGLPWEVPQVNIGLSVMCGHHVMMYRVPTVVKILRNGQNLQEQLAVLEVLGLRLEVLGLGL